MVTANIFTTFINNGYFTNNISPANVVFRHY